MKLKLQITIDEPNLEETFKRLGPYRKVIFIKEAIRKYYSSSDGQKLISSLLGRKSNITKRKDEVINLDNIL